MMHILVCDDHPIVGTAIAMTIETAFDAVVHVVPNYAAAAAVAAVTPDLRLCLLDIHIPGDDARAGVAALQVSLPAARFMLFSGSEDDADLMMTMELGLHGFLPKSSTPEVVEAALRLVLAGGTYLPSRFGQIALHGATRLPEPAATSVPADRTAIYGHLTERQHFVLQQVAAGRSNKEIARDLTISPATVKAHVAQIIAVMGATNRTEASAKARGLGLL